MTFSVLCLQIVNKIKYISIKENLKLSAYQSFKMLSINFPRTLKHPREVMFAKMSVSMFSSDGTTLVCVTKKINKTLKTTKK